MYKHFGIHSLIKKIAHVYTIQKQLCFEIAESRVYLRDPCVHNLCRKFTLIKQRNDLCPGEDFIKC